MLRFLKRILDRQFELKLSRGFKVRVQAGDCRSVEVLRKDRLCYEGDER